MALPHNQQIPTPLYHQIHHRRMREREECPRNRIIVDEGVGLSNLRDITDIVVENFNISVDNT